MFVRHGTGPPRTTNTRNFLNNYTCLAADIGPPGCPPVTVSYNTLSDNGTGTAALA